MLPTVCLLAILAIHTAIRVAQFVVRVVDLDVWDALVYLGLAEYHGAPSPLDAGR